MVSVAGWPRVTSQRVEWRPTIPPELVSNRMRQRHQGAYSAAVVPRISQAQAPLPSAVSALATDAAAEIARFDAELGIQTAPFTAVLLRSESAASSQIEQLTASAEAIALAELGDTNRRNATEIVGNVHAMEAAISLAESVEPESILTMHRALLFGTAPNIAGWWRGEQVWIGGTSYGPHEAAFVPPVAADVPALIDDLVEFSSRTDLAPLVQSALAHAQFETIHPFPDGNGRTGRALLQAMLRYSGLTRTVTIPISAGLLSNIGRYFDALTAYRDGETAPIVSAVAHAGLDAVIGGRQLVADLRQVREGWRTQVRARQGSGTIKLLDHLIQQPAVDAEAVARALGIESRNVGRVIAPLVEAGVVTETTGGRRNRIWLAPEVLRALDDFAARSIRQHPA